MSHHVLEVVVFYFLVLRANSFEFENFEEFKISNADVEQLRNCQRTQSDSGRFSLKILDTVYQLPDVCGEDDLKKLNFFPKCCPPNYNYQSRKHRCVNDINSTNIYDYESNLLVRSHLDCPVTINHIIEEQFITFHKNKSITFNKTLYKVDDYCIDWDESNNSTILRTCEERKSCTKKKCITKCCKEGSAYVGNKCVWNPEFGISVANNIRFENRTDDFSGIIQAQKCRKFKDKPTYNFTIKPNGNLHILHQDQWLEFTPEDNKYCLEYYKPEDQYVVFVCAFTNNDVDYKQNVLRALNIISCISLIFTILGYLFLRELKNFLGKIIIWYCGCLLLAMVFLTYGRFNPNDENICIPLPFLVIFFYLAAFAWMNVLSFEIWQVLGSMSTQFGTQLYNEKKKLLCYHMYAWILPTLLLVFGVVAYLSDEMPAHLKPVIGQRYCFFETNSHERNYGYFIFFAAPALICILVNAVLFTKTIRYILKVKNDIRDVTKHNFSERQKRFNIDKERVAMVLRIFIIMGLSWIFEFILVYRTHFSDYKVLEIIEFISDIFNSLQGFLIFLVFMAKKKIFTAVKQKFRPKKLHRSNTTEVIVSCSAK